MAVCSIHSLLSVFYKGENVYGKMSQVWRLYVFSTKLLDCILSLSSFAILTPSQPHDFVLLLVNLPEKIYVLGNKKKPGNNLWLFNYK